MIEEKILACPFCGEEGDLTTTTCDETIDHRHTVICSPGCGGSGPVTVSPALAIMAWNERAGGRQPEAVPNAELKPVRFGELLAAGDDLYKACCSLMRNGRHSLDYQWKNLENAAMRYNAKHQAAENGGVSS